ncbi:MAG TPA: hypothetical protein VK550_07425 [Polyangiaceae bacterium]|nr:hypothetical protein [Polyangiaceae bacterium]
MGGLIVPLCPTRLRRFRSRWGLGAALLLTATVCCTSQSNESVCASVTSHPDGIHVADCANGTISLDDIQYDRNGGKLSYDFLVTCHGRSARGTWTRTGRLTCLEGATDPCKSGGVCTPTSDDDCRSIANCKEWGDCAYQNGKCVPTEDGCAHSDVPCGLSGQCHLGPDGVCIVVSDADCQTPFGICPNCTYKGACLTSGGCYAESGACVARSSADCKKSTQCAFAGKCTLDASTCVAATDADCRPSEVCRTARQCAAIDGVCTVTP